MHSLAAFADCKFPRVWLMVTMCTRPLSVISLDELAAQGRLDELKFRLEIDLEAGHPAAHQLRLRLLGSGGHSRYGGEEVLSRDELV